MKKNKLLLPIAAGLGIALFARKTNGHSKTIDKGFVFKCNPVEFYITDQTRAYEYFEAVTAVMFKKYSNPDKVDFHSYLKELLLKISTGCYKRYVSGEMTREELMATSLVFLQGYRAYLVQAFGAEYVNADLNEDLQKDLTEKEKEEFEDYVTYMDNYAQPQWEKILASFQFTEEELKKINEIEEKGAL